MGQATRTTTLPLDLSPHEQGGSNAGNRAALVETLCLLTAARAFYLDFFLAHPAKLQERVEVVSSQTGEVEDRLISPEKLLASAESQTVVPHDHPEPLPGWDFSTRFPDLPYQYRRAVIKGAIGKARGYLAHLTTWQRAGKSKGKPGVPGAADHLTSWGVISTLATTTSSLASWGGIGTLCPLIMNCTTDLATFGGMRMNCCRCFAPCSIPLALPTFARR